MTGFYSRGYRILKLYVFPEVFSKFIIIFPGSPTSSTVTKKFPKISRRVFLIFQKGNKLSRSTETIKKKKKNSWKFSNLFRHSTNFLGTPLKWNYFSQRLTSYPKTLNFSDVWLFSRNCWKCELISEKVGRGFFQSSSSFQKDPWIFQNFWKDLRRFVN